MNHKNGQIAQHIIELQKEDGTWGNEFHSLAMPNNKTPLTTEQALRRLQLLGFTIKDSPIRKAVDCMTSCLRGERKIDNYWEKTQDWNLFTKLMLSTWIKIFEPDNALALTFAKQWATIIEKTFADGAYNHETYQKAYQEEFYQKTKGPQELDFVSFYPINLLQGLLSEETESRYLAAIDILLGYRTAKEKLGFVIKWLEENQDINGQWDLGAKVKDNLYFPLSDSWRNTTYRQADCTEKISLILEKLKG